LLEHPRWLPHVLYWAGLTVIAVTAMHVHVLTRFVGAVPYLYWSMAAAPPGSWWQRATLAYGLLYTVLGAVLFPNFYPWT
jgi:phosphatidylinositol glycan class V